jgi:putative flippase GtrA
VQFACFVAFNMVWLYVAFAPEVAAGYHAGHESWAVRWLWHPLWNPPAVGRWVYLSQLIGIAAGTAWNYLLNFYWTWGAGDGRG